MVVLQTISVALIPAVASIILAVLLSDTAFCISLLEVFTVLKCCSFTVPGEMLANAAVSQVAISLPVSLGNFSLLNSISKPVAVSCSNSLLSVVQILIID